MERLVDDYFVNPRLNLPFAMTRHRHMKSSVYGRAKYYLKVLELLAVSGPIPNEAYDND
jgi:hypothetical protein